MVISVLLRHTVDVLIVRKSITIHMFIHTQSLRISIILVSVPAHTRDLGRRWQCNYARSPVRFFLSFCVSRSKISHQSMRPSSTSIHLMVIVRPIRSNESEKECVYVFVRRERMKRTEDKIAADTNVRDGLVLFGFFALSHDHHNIDARSFIIVITRAALSLLSQRRCRVDSHSFPFFFCLRRRTILPRSFFR